jgi:NAD+ kinase
MKPIKKITFVINPFKVNGQKLTEQLTSIANQIGVKTAHIKTYPLPENSLSNTEVCCVIGGDGSLLSVVEQAANQNVAVLGINLGTLGFMATFSPEQAIENFSQLLQGNYQITQRTLLHCRNAKGHSRLALNDVVIKISSSHLLPLAVYSGEELVNKYICDGLIFCTPTGSTAYNLSAGGPLIHPDSAVIAMTPICPHTLSNRSVIFDNQKSLRILLRQSHHNVHVSLDGQTYFEKHEDFPVEVSVADKTLKLIHYPTHSYYQIMRGKLRW